MTRYLWCGILGALAAVLVHSCAHARDPDGRYAQSPLKPWFDQLHSGRGPCCSDADGTAVSDPDWKRQRKRIGYYPMNNGETGEIISEYAVRVDGNWIDVPPDAVITEKNRVGITMVWPLRGYMSVSIRCFMPGPET